MWPSSSSAQTIHSVLGILSLWHQPGNFHEARDLSELYIPLEVLNELKRSLEDLLEINDRDFYQVS